MKNILLLPLLMAAVAATAQTTAPRDVLHKTDRTTLEGRIDEVGDVNVFYFPASDLASRRMIARRLVWKIVFADGTTEVLNQPQATPPAQPEAALVNPTPSSAPVQTVLATADWLRAGSRALSFSVTLSGESASTKNRLATAKSSESNLTLSVGYQHFLGDNLSVLGLVAYSRSVETSPSQAESSAPLVLAGGYLRRFLPLGRHVALFGSAGAGYTQVWVRTKTRDGKQQTNATLQTFAAGLGAGAAYQFAPGWSVDLTTDVLAAGVTTTKVNSPGAKPISVFTLGGDNLMSSFSVSLTRYF